jgi:hypothetical protein
MSTDETLLTLSLELAEAYDSTLDTSEGSPFRSQFLNPLLERVGGSPLDGDLETFLVERLRAEIPDIDVSRNSGMRDLVVRAAVAVLEPFRREINGIQTAQSLNNFETMTRDEVNALLGNYFTEAATGGVATGTVRMYFASARSVVVSPVTRFYTGGGLNFFPSTVQSINSSQMSFNQDGNLYFVDFVVQAENAGVEYNLEPGDLTNVSGLVGVVRVTNLARFQSGLDEETKEEAIGRTQNSITIRNLITDRGARFVLPEAFPQVDTLQVIGFGDDEMRRDVISGLTDISNIPGGIAGKDDPGLGGSGVHIGGKTDIYIYQQVLDIDDLTIEDVTDKGIRVFAGSHGFTQGGGDTFEDEFGFFDKRGIVNGDLLLLGTDSYTISGFAAGTLTVSPATLPASLFGQTYEIVSTSPPDYVDIPLYDLVAELGGASVFDDDDDPVAPIPGSLALAALETGGVPEKKTDDVARENLNLAILRVTTLEQIDPLTLESSGITIPMLDPLLFFALEAFTGGDGGNATGTIRVWFRDPTNAWVTAASTLFTYQSVRTFSPIAEETGTANSSTASGSSGGQVINLSGGNFTPAGLGLVDAGYRITILSGPAAGTYTVLSGSYDAGDVETDLNIRETLPDDITAEDWQLHVGIAESNMPSDAATGLYYFDVDVVAVQTGTDSDLAEDAELTAAGFLSEGWSLKSTKDVLSFSARDLPYLRLTEWVNDDFLIVDVGTAPAVKVNYEYSSDVVDIQAFADDDANRIVAEDVLIRHYLPTYVRMQVTQRGLTADAAKQVIVDFINELDPTRGLEASDAVDALYNAGSTYVQLPLTLVGLIQSPSRAWSVNIDQDSLGTDRVVHFIADEDFITVVEDS